MLKALFYNVWGNEFDISNKTLNYIKETKPTSILVYNGYEFFPTTRDNYSEETDIIEQKIADYLYSNNIELNIVYGSMEFIEGPRKYFKFIKPKEIYFPMAWGYHTVDFSYRKNSFFKNTFPSVVPVKHFLSLVNKSHYHRMVGMDILSKYNLLESSISFSWHKNGGFNQENYKFKYWEEKLSTLDDNYENLLENYDTIPNSMWDTALNIVMETTDKGIFWTEKTFQPIIFNKPFIIMGSIGSNLQLKKFGFKLFEHLFDYESFDYIDDISTRYSLIANQLNTIKLKYTPQELYESCIDIINHNKNNLINIIENRLFIPDTFKELLLENNITLKDKNILVNIPI